MSDGFAALRSAAVRRYAAARLLAFLAAQMVSVAMGWQLYELTSSPFALGLVGLVQIVPVVLLALPAGHVADRFRRRDVAIGAHALLALCCAALALVSARTGPVFLVYLLALGLGVGGAFRAPAVATMLPQLLAAEHLRNANAWLSSGAQLAMIVGPALGGFLIALSGGETWVYSLASGTHLLLAMLLATLPSPAPARRRGEATWRDLLAGARFVFRTKVFLAAITLDLFAVLFGGATALMPIFAKDILRVGPTGLGWLRAAPAIGAFVMAIIQTRLPPWKRWGRVLLLAVAGFGATTIVFGLSRSFWLSLTMLALCGLFDNISVVLRQTLEQVLTPDEMRGRVSAIHYIFIGCSNELGSFESGATAALFGSVASVVGGGVGTLIVVVAVAAIWPALRRLGSLDAPAREAALEPPASLPPAA